MLILRKPTRAELTVRRSRFLSEATPVGSPEAARELWRERKKTYTNGGHIVFAFVCGPQGGVMGVPTTANPPGRPGGPCSKSSNQAA